MRFNDDEAITLRALAAGRKPAFADIGSGMLPINNWPPFTVPIYSFSRHSAILKSLRYHGLIDESDELTRRGRHVASNLPAIQEVEDIGPTVEETETPFDEYEEWN